MEEGHSSDRSDSWLFVDNHQHLESRLEVTVISQQDFQSMKRYGQVPSRGTARITAT